LFNHAMETSKTSTTLKKSLGLVATVLCILQRISKLVSLLCNCKSDTFYLGHRVAVKAMQKSKIQDLKAFSNEI